MTVHTTVRLLPCPNFRKMPYVARICESVFSMVAGSYRFKLLYASCFLLIAQFGYAQKAPGIRRDTFRNEAYGKLSIRSSKKYGSSEKGKSQLQTTSVYDLDGNLTSIDTFSYDSSGLVISTQRFSYRYEKLKVVKFGINLSEGHSDTIWTQGFHFDEHDRLIKLEETNSHTLATRTESYTYDNYGNCNLIVVSLNGMDFKEYRYDFTYDERGNLIRIKSDDEIVEENTYDASNRLISHKSGSCTEQFTYRADGKLMSRKQQCAANPYVAGTCLDQLDSYTYNKKDQLVHHSVKCLDSEQSTRIIGLNHQTTYTYDKNGLIKHLEIQSEGYRWNNQFKYEF